MREFYIDNGNYKGIHYIYDSIEEFQEKNPTATFKRWQREDSIKDIEIGDWVQVNDGYITQCLNKTFAKSGRTTFVRFPMKTGIVQKLSSGRETWQRVFAQTANIDAGSGSGKTAAKRGTKRNTKKAAFASFILAGYTYKQAYEKAGFEWITVSSSQYKADLIEVLLDPMVQEILKQKSQDYLSKIKNDEAFSDENMIQFIKDFMVNVRKGSVSHLNSLIPLLKLAGKIDVE